MICQCSKDVLFANSKDRGGIVGLLVSDKVRYFVVTELNIWFIS